MQNANASDVIERAIATVAEASREQTGPLNAPCLQPV